MKQSSGVDLRKCKSFVVATMHENGPGNPSSSSEGDDKSVCKIVIAQCTDEKRDGEHEAQELYMPSDLFKAQRRYGESYGDHWLILSGKYGLLTPQAEIPSYDHHISDGYASEIIQERVDEFFKSAQSGAIRTVGRFAGEHPPKVVLPDQEIHFELICGEDYAERLEWYLDHYDLRYSKPFEGLRYAERIDAMQQEARKVENHQLAAYA